MGIVKNPVEKFQVVVTESRKTGTDTHPHELRERERGRESN